MIDGERNPFQWIARRIYEFPYISCVLFLDVSACRVNSVFDAPQNACTGGKIQQIEIPYYSFACYGPQPLATCYGTQPLATWLAGPAFGRTKREVRFPMTSGGKTHVRLV